MTMMTMMKMVLTMMITRVMMMMMMRRSMRRKGMMMITMVMAMMITRVMRRKGMMMKMVIAMMAQSPGLLTTRRGQIYAYTKREAAIGTMSSPSCPIYLAKQKICPLLQKRIDMISNLGPWLKK